jgi:pyocin large subunit-like protein
MWGESRRYSAQESAERQFERNGKAFSADRLDDHVAKTNIVAVMANSGAPKAFFKPDDGADYW